MNRIGDNMANIPIKKRKLMINAFMQCYIEEKVARYSRQDIILRMALSAKPDTTTSNDFTNLKVAAGIIYDQMFSGVCRSYDYTASV